MRWLWGVVRGTLGFSDDETDLQSIRYQMKRELSDWRSFWDIATPQQGATALIEIYGPAAAKAVMSCAAAALDDNRDEDYQFWTAVLGCVQAAERAGASRAIRN